MRSRYSAYAMGGQGEYLLKTWFPATAQDLTAEQLDQQTVEWLQLEVVDKSQRGDAGMVEFKAWFRDGEGQRQLLHEKSVFARAGGRWFYVGCEVDYHGND
jgi:SEC-C motif-containing protein